MKGVIRPPRGRPSKVAKASTPTRRPGRPQGGLGLSLDKIGVVGYPDDAGMVEDISAAAAAAAAAAATAAVEAELGDAEADADMEEDDQADQHHPVGAHTENMDLNTAANILANGGAGIASDIHPPTPLQHQQLDSLEPAFVKATEDVARDSGYGELNVESALAKRLAREPGLRLAQQRRPEQQLNLARRSNVEALFAHIAGEMAPQQCKNCHKGHGPWTSCVIVDGQMCGSCANCWFNASGARCSFHETRNPQALHHQHSLLANSSTGGAADTSTNFAMQPPMTLPASHGTALAALSLSTGALNMTNDPVVRYTVERALAEVRAADRRTRQIMLIEMAAKKLAMRIAEYEELSAGEQQQPHPLQEQQLQTPSGHADGEQALVDDEPT